MLESRTLPDPTIREGLKEFVWVKAYEDQQLNQRFGLGGYPTMVFLDPEGERVLSKSSGYEPAGSFLRMVLQARKAAELPLTERELTGQGVRTGEAYFSVKHSRFQLERGAEVRVYWGSDFMLMDDWKGIRQYVDKEKAAELEAAPAGSPFFWLFDACDRTTGLHAEQAKFEEIRAVNDGKPYDDKDYFKFLRGDILRPGQVYTLRSVRKDCYAKLQITEVTLVPQP